MAIHPYPVLLGMAVTQRRAVTIRRFARKTQKWKRTSSLNMSDEANYFPLHGHHPGADPADAVRFTQIDDDREMALVATICEEDGTGKADRCFALRFQPGGESVEFALAVHDDWQKHGIGRKLMTALIECARTKGFIVPLWVMFWR